MLSKVRKASRLWIAAQLTGTILVVLCWPSFAQSAPGLEGTWEVTVTTSSGRVFTSLITYMKGGGMILTENGGPAAAFNAGQGTWAKSEDHVYIFRWKRFHFHPVSGDFLFTLQVWGELELEPEFQEYFGIGVADRILPDGTVIPGFSTTTTHGIRLTAE